MTEPLVPPEVNLRGLPSSRNAAIELGARRYFDGKPCPHGHVAERYTLNGYCVDCQRQRNREDRARARERMR